MIKAGATPAFFVSMLCVIPYKLPRDGGIELKYCLRGIEQFVPGAEIVLIGQKPDWLQNAEHIPFADADELCFKERNIFEKILQVKRDFLFFNDDHFLLKPFSKDTYDFSGSLTERMNSYGSSNNQFWQTIYNTISIIGDGPNYFRHAPIFVKYKILKHFQLFDWSIPWGYCVKSLYCHYAGIKGTDYPDLKLMLPMTYEQIKNITRSRDYFSSDNIGINQDMISFLEETYPHKSQFEK